MSGNLDPEQRTRFADEMEFLSGFRVLLMASKESSSDDGTLRDDFFRDLRRRGYTADDTQRQLDIPSTGAATANCSPCWHCSRLTWGRLGAGHYAQVQTATGGSRPAWRKADEH
jgi:hypothetical protein